MVSDNTKKEISGIGIFAICLDSKTICLGSKLINLQHNTYLFLLLILSLLIQNFFLTMLYQTKVDCK